MNQFLFFPCSFFLQPRWKQSYQFRMKFLAKIKALLFYKTMTPINFLMVVVSCWNIVRSKMKKSRNLPIWKEKQNYQLLFYFHYSTFLRNFIFFPRAIQAYLVMPSNIQIDEKKRLTCVIDRKPLVPETMSFYYPWQHFWG